MPANLPPAEWLKELQDTLKKQSEAAIALIRLTTDAAQRIQQYTTRANSSIKLNLKETQRVNILEGPIETAVQRAVDFYKAQGFNPSDSGQSEQSTETRSDISESAYAGTRFSARRTTRHGNWGSL